MSINPYRKYFLKGLEPDPLFSVSQWADERRILPKNSSAEPGRWRTSRFPFLREIMDELSPHSKTQQVKLIKGTQIGGTEIGNNFVMTYMDIYPASMLLICVSEKLLKKHRMDKLIPSLKAMPKLASKIIRGKTKEDLGDAEAMRFPGGSLNFGYSNSTANFRSLSCRVVVLDDVDGFPMDVEGEGSPMALGKKRTDAFANRKIYINSTPTIKGNSNIEREYEESDQREYHMKCPECDELVRFDFDYFSFEYDKVTYTLIDDVHFCCPECGSLIPEYKKTQMMKEEKGAKWVPGKEHIHKGYKLPSYYSPILTWNEIFTEFLEAKKALNSGDNRLMKTWKNTRAAEVWEEENEKADVTIFNDRLEQYGAAVPEGVYILTAGVDTQDDRLELEIVGWGKYGESWSIDYIILDGDPKFPKVWEKLDKYLIDKRYKHISGMEMSILATCIDTGGHRTDYVYAYCRPRYELNIFAIKGSSTIDAPLIPTRASKTAKGGAMPIYLVGSNNGKDTVFANIMTKEPGPGYMHYPKKAIYDQSYFKQLTAEKRDISGRWKKFRQRNEALDVRVYAKAALGLFEMQNFPDGLDWDDVEEEFNSRIEEDLDSNIEEETTDSESSNYNDWRDQY
ncbi:MAG: terminase gpA endonuclease subunit [Arcobacteraceae bacterium]